MTSRRPDERGPEDRGLQPRARRDRTDLGAKGQTIDTIIPDARIKYLSGAITEDQLKAQIKRWYDAGGTQIAQEVNDLVSKVGG